MTGTASNPNLVVEQESPGVLRVRLSGNSREQSEAPSVKVVREALDQAPGVKSLSFESAGLTGWDSRFVAFIRNCAALCRERQVEFRDDGLPAGLRRLLRLAQAVPEKKDVRHAAAKAPFLRSVGERALKGWEGTLELLTFLGENAMALGKLVKESSCGEIVRRAPRHTGLPSTSGGSATGLSATDAWAEPLSVIQNSALKMIEKSIFSNCAQALAWYFNDGHAMTVMSGSSRRCSRERGGSSSAGLRCNRFTSSAAPSL